MVAEAVTASVEEFCASRGQAVAGRPPASNPASVAITTPSRGIRPASLSRRKRILPQRRSRLLSTDEGEHASGRALQPVGLC